jgi:SAM-dependent methyltransferase
MFERVKLKCPCCRSGRLRDEFSRALVCPGCGAAYPLREGFADLLPGLSQARSLPQLAMESGFVISIYDSLLWRRNPLLQVFMGLSFEQEADLILGALEVKGGDIVLDLACGTGILGRRIASRVPESLIVGIDLSVPMLSYASGRYDEQGTRERLLIHADAQDLPLEDASVDAALCAGALHLFPDAGKALREAGRVLKQGGRFAAAAYYRGSSPVSWFVEQMAGIVGGVRGHTLDEYRRMIREAGFEGMDLLHQGPVWMVMSGTRSKDAAVRP